MYTYKIIRPTTTMSTSTTSIVVTNRRLTIIQAVMELLIHIDTVYVSKKRNVFEQLLIMLSPPRC